MKIEFADERIKEYSQGMSFHLTNEGKPIDVSTANGATLLKAKHWLDGEWVNTFRMVGSAPKKVSEVKAIESDYPENFPHSDLLSKAGIAHADIVNFDREQLSGLKVKGIGPKGIEEIFAAITE